MKLNNYTIIDVETASRRMPSICSLGLVHVSEGRVVARHHYYIKPPGRFEFWNVKVHGIEPYQVKTAPRFGEVWPFIKDYCENSILIAHNASFDLGQLTASLLEAGISHTDFYYIDTVKMANRLFPDFPKYNLAYLSLVLDANLGSHHDALADASATGEIFDSMQNKYPLERSNISIYSTKDSRECINQEFSGFFEELMSILEPLRADESLGYKVTHELEDWLEEVKSLDNCYMLEELMPRINFIIKRGVYDEGVYWIINRLKMNYYYEKRTVNIGASLRAILKIFESDDESQISHWLEVNFQMREEYIFDELWRKIWEYHHHGQGDRAEILRLIHFYNQPFDGYYSKDKVQGQEGLLIGGLPTKYAKKVYNELNSVGARLVGKSPRKVDFAIIVCGKKGLDYSPKVRKLLRLKEEGEPIKLYRIGRR